MAVLRFTPAGVVPTPTVVQIRVTALHPGKVAVGLPDPARALTDDEIAANLLHFTVGLRGPRTVPCDELVLTGADLAGRPGLASRVAQGRADGLRRVILHLGRGERAAFAGSALAGLVDEVVVLAAGDDDIADVAALAGAGVAVNVVLVLDHAGLVELEPRTRRVLDAGPARLTFTWPLQGPAPPPIPAVIAAAAPAWASVRDAGAHLAIRGMPTCALGEFADYASKARNRWYVDVDHQGSRALLFFPDVIRMARRDVCRHCVRSDRCDGAPEAWLEAGLVPLFEPYR